jgi:hypothetical protein
MCVIDKEDKASKINIDLAEVSAARKRGRDNETEKL